MEESYETFEEELRPSRPETAPQKPVRQIRRPEMYASRKLKEEPAPVVQLQPQQVPKTQPREPSFPARTMPLRKSMSVENLMQTETPWENVTLNRCLFVAITILVLTSGFQRLHETLRGRRATEEVMEEEEEVGLRVRRSGALRHRGQPPEPETSLWEVLFWWLPDFHDDDEDEDDDEDGGEVRRGKSGRAGRERGSRLRNRPQPDKKLTKQRDGKFRDRRAKKDQNEEIKKKKKEMEKENKHSEEDEEEEEELEEEEEVIPKKKKKVQEEKKEKTKAHKT